MNKYKRIYIYVYTYTYKCFLALAWLSPLRGWGSLTVAFLGKFANLHIYYILHIYIIYIMYICKKSHIILPYLARSLWVNSPDYMSSFTAVHRLHLHFLYR